MHLVTVCKNLWRDEEGASAVEYALIAGLVAIVLVAAISTDFKDKFKALFDALAQSFQDAADDLTGDTAD
jgi:pilus assembly protein Flp/PilA